MPLLLHRGFRGRALLEIPLLACQITFLVCYSIHVVCLGFVSSYLVSPTIPSLLQAYQDFRILNCLRPWILFFISLFVIWSAWAGWQPWFLFSFSWLVTLPSTGLPLRCMFPNLPVPNPSMFYDYWNFCFLCWILREVYMHLIHWSFNLMLQNDAFSSLGG